MDLGVSDLKGEGRVIGRVELAYRFWKALTSLTSRTGWAHESRAAAVSIAVKDRLWPCGRLEQWRFILDKRSFASLRRKCSMVLIDSRSSSFAWLRRGFESQWWSRFMVKHLQYQITVLSSSFTLFSPGERAESCVHAKTSTRLSEGCLVVQRIAGAYDYLVFPKVEYTPLGEVAVGHALNSKLTAPTALVLFVEFHFR
ncbi:LOW QUALITY PROTEIN: hypothetical protein HID58_052559 [Brassica napus]|uniref:Uncharacterized protein n=1 Tax=Brassica napus TaxID=3708 RepID=A0ABQ8AC61_BRANA|nr:LOW QUALITY PROTEIN: hypothetical protein HID58_052559 [Brassica napus]